MSDPPPPLPLRNGLIGGGGCSVEAGLWPCTATHPQAVDEGHLCGGGGGGGQEAGAPLGPVGETGVCVPLQPLPSWRPHS